MRTSVSSWAPASGPKAPSARRSVYPVMTFSGVRSSCDMVATNSDLSRLADWRSAIRRAFSNATVVACAMPSASRRSFGDIGPVRVRQPFTRTATMSSPRAIGTEQDDEASMRRASSSGTSDCVRTSGISRTSPGRSAAMTGRLSAGNSSCASSVRTSGFQPAFAARRNASRRVSQTNVLLQSQPTVSMARRLTRSSRVA